MSHGHHFRPVVVHFSRLDIPYLLLKAVSLAVKRFHNKYFDDTLHGCVESSPSYSYYYDTVIWKLAFFLIKALAKICLSSSFRRRTVSEKKRDIPIWQSVTKKKKYNSTFLSMLWLQSGIESGNVTGLGQNQVDSNPWPR
jgi:hypothetical protein